MRLLVQTLILCNIAKSSLASGLISKLIDYCYEFGGSIQKCNLFSIDIDASQCEFTKDIFKLANKEWSYQDFGDWDEICHHGILQSPVDLPRTSDIF